MASLVSHIMPIRLASVAGKICIYVVTSDPPMEIRMVEVTLERGRSVMPLLVYYEGL